MCGAWGGVGESLATFGVTVAPVKRTQVRVGETNVLWTQGLERFGIPTQRDSHLHKLQKSPTKLGLGVAVGV